VEGADPGAEPNRGQQESLGGRAHETQRMPPRAHRIADGENAKCSRAAVSLHTFSKRSSRGTACGQTPNLWLWHVEQKRKGVGPKMSYGLIGQFGSGFAPREACDRIASEPVAQGLAFVCWLMWPQQGS
jgi:hypothetical protein